VSLRVGFDIDGVLADFKTAFRETARRLSRRPVQETPADPEQTPQGMSASEVRRVWKAIERTPQWWMQLQAFEPSEIERLYTVSRERRWEVYFLTTRPPSAGETPQFQTQWWLEQHGFYLPSVVTVPGSRGELANALRLDLAIDDQFVNCAEIIAASATKTVLMLRQADPMMQQHASDRGIGVVSSLTEALPVLERLHDLLPARRGRLLRLADWFSPRSDHTLPQNPRAIRPLPDEDTGPSSVKSKD
jgi:hypothetical protein